MSALHTDATKRHDVVFLFDVTDGNPNGDPDAGNLPRVDPETMEGLVSDVSIKRKIRNYVDITHGAEGQFKIYVQDDGVALNARHREAYDAEKLTSTGPIQARGDVHKARTWMCNNFYDIRTFGAVMTTKVNAGQVRGPVQVTWSRSVNQIVPLDHSITRMAVTKEEDAKVVIGDDGTGKGGKQSTMARKSLVPYGLYRGSIFISPHQAAQTGFSNRDLELLWEALIQMWDFDHSASRGLMACRGLYVFSHENPFGNAPAHKLLSLIPKPTTTKKSPRSFSDYSVNIPDATDLTALGFPGVTLTRLEG